MLNNKEIKTTLNTAIDEITEVLENYSCVYKKPYANKTYDLYAVGGDLSASGMSNQSTVLTIKREQMFKVEAYVEVQRIWHETLTMLCIGLEKVHKKHNKTFDVLYQLWRESNALMADIFDNKYCYRSTWAFLSK